MRNLHENLSIKTPEPEQLLDPGVRQVLESANAMMQVHDLTKGNRGVIHIDPGVASIAIHVAPSQYNQDAMHDIRIKIDPHLAGVHTNMLDNIHLAINNGQNDRWRLSPLSEGGEAWFTVVPNKSISNIRVVFPEESAAMRRKNGLE